MCGSVAVSALAVAIAISLALPAAPAFAGGMDFDTTTQSDDPGPPYLGVVTDQNGTPVPDTKIAITAPMLGRTLVERADSQGHFFVQPFDKSVSPKDISITCIKDGYNAATATKNITPDPSAPVDAVCILHKR